MTKPPSSAALDSLAKKIEEIPTLPVVSKKIMTILDDESVDFRKISDLIEKDQSLAVKVLKVANSSFYSTMSNVNTIDHAIAILGIDEIRSILVGFSVYNFFKKDDNSFFDRSLFWKHSIICSQIAKYLANYFRVRDDSIFLAGLIHDMGKVVFDKYFHDDFIKVINFVSENNESFNRAEKEIIGVKHYQVAAKLLQQWNFPPNVTRYVFYHHAPWHDKNYTNGSIIVYLANIFTKLTGHSSIPEERQMEPAEIFDVRIFDFLSRNGFDLDLKTIEVMTCNIQEYIALENQEVLGMFD